jgi:ankyrin repeat protein
MASLKDLATAAEIRYAINNLRQGSDSYKSAYETAIQRIRGQSVSRTKLANKVLAWIVYAKRVLKASELRLALGVEVGKRKLDYDSCPDVDMMVSVCAGLVTIDESADTIRLVHYTAQTFFDNVKSTILPSAETEIAKICLTYLSLKIFARPQHGDGYQSDSPSEGEEDGELLEQYLSDSNQGSLLYEYAAQYWGVHARKAPDAHKCVMKFLSWRSYITRAYEAATKLYGYEYRKSSLVSVDGLHLASMFGLEQAVGQILRERLSDPDVVIGLEPTRYWSEPLDGTGFYLTPLTIAASQNHPRIVKMLLDSGATLGVVSLDEGNKYKGTTALNVASEGSFEIIVDILLRANAALHNQVGVGEISNLQIGQHEQSMKSTLGIGPRKSHDEIGVPLHHTLRPIVDLPDKYGWSPLFIASHRGCDKIVDMLLRHGADVNFQSESRCSPSFKVCDDGLYEVIPMLRQSSTTQRTLSQHLFSPLYVASADGRLPVVKALLHHGAKVDAINKYSLSPLYAACANGHIDIAKILLKNGANTNAPCHSYRSPLYGAASNGHIDIVKILLQKGTNVDAPCHTNYSPLHGAASNGRVEIFKLLQHQVSEINPHNDQSPSCLHGASHGGHVEIVKMLLEHGANTHLEKKAQFSPIHAAIVNKRLEVFNLLISYGANPNQTESVHTPLQIAMHWYQGEGGVYSSGQTMIKRLKELGGKTSPEYHRQTILELMRERREKKASSAEQQEPVDLPGEHS